MIASMYQPDIVKKLLEYSHLDINAVDKDMRSALLIAARSNYNALVYLASDDRVNMYQLDKNDNNVFICAIEGAILGNIKYLLKHPEVNVHQKDDKGANAFILARNKYTIRILLKETCIDINTSDNRGVTPLMIAAQLGDANIIHEFLKDLEININAIGERGRPAFMYAIWQFGTSEAITCFLKDKRLDINLGDEHGITAFMDALKYSSIEDITRFLKDERLDTDQTDARGNNALIYAVHSTEKMLLLLESKRFDVNSKDKNGQTVLMYAVLNRFYQTTTLLLESATIDLNCVDDLNHSALFIAMMRPNEDAFIKLMKHPNINARVTDLRNLKNFKHFVYYTQMAYKFNHRTKQLVDIQHEIARRLEDVNILDFQRTLSKKEDNIDEEENEEEEEIKIFHHKKVIELREKENLLLLTAFDVNVYNVKSGETCIGFFKRYASQLLLLPGIDLYKYDYNLTYMHDFIENKDESFKKVMIRSFPPEIRYLKTMRCKNNEMSKLWIMIGDQAICYSNPYKDAEINRKISSQPCLRTNDYNIILPLEIYASRLLNILFRIEKVPHKDTRLYRLVY